MILVLIVILISRIVMILAVFGVGYSGHLKHCPGNPLKAGGVCWRVPALLDDIGQGRLAGQTD